MGPWLGALVVIVLYSTLIALPFVYLWDLERRDEEGDDE